MAGNKDENMTAQSIDPALVKTGGRSLPMTQQGVNSMVAKALAEQSTRVVHFDNIQFSGKMIIGACGSVIAAAVAIGAAILSIKGDVKDGDANLTKDIATVKTELATLRVILDERLPSKSFESPPTSIDTRSPTPDKAKGAVPNP